MMGFPAARPPARRRMVPLLAPVWTFIVKCNAWTVPLLYVMTKELRTVGPVTDWTVEVAEAMLTLAVAHPEPVQATGP